MLYLNDKFTGGHTQFLYKQSNGVSKVVANIKPRTGSVVIFTQDALHEGLPVNTGCKYIMRTDIMFRRVAGDWIKPYSNEMYLSLAGDPSYNKTVELLDKSEKKEKTGELVESTG